jgi:hypothetical protein
MSEVQSKSPVDHLSDIVKVFGEEERACAEDNAE